MKKYKVNGIIVKASSLQDAIKRYKIKDTSSAAVIVKQYPILEKYAKTGKYSYEQIEELAKGLDEGQDITKYAHPGYSSDSMIEIRKGLKHGVDILKYINPRMGMWQIYYIRKGLEAKVDVARYADWKYTPEQMKKILQDLLKRR